MEVKKLGKDNNNKRTTSGDEHLRLSGAPADLAPLAPWIDGACRNIPNTFSPSHVKDKKLSLAGIVTYVKWGFIKWENVPDT